MNRTMFCGNNLTERLTGYLKSCCARLVDGLTMNRTMFCGNKDQMPLWCAASEGNLEMVRYLIEDGAQVDGELTYGTTQLSPVRLACQFGHIEVVKLLVMHNADLEIRPTSNYGETCLMAACFGGYVEIVSYLLSWNVLRNRECSKGKTALHYSVMRQSSNQLEVVQLLLKAEVDIKKDIDGMTPLFMAAMYGQNVALEYLMDSDLFTPEEKAAALELLGVWHAWGKDDCDVALRSWCRALKLRKEKGIEKVPGPPTVAYLNATEVQEVDDYFLMRNDLDQVHMQAVFLLERVLGPGHRTVTVLILKFAWNYKVRGYYERSVSLGIHRLESLAIHQEALSHDFFGLFDMLATVVQDVFQGSDIHLGSDEARKNSFGEPVVRLVELALCEVHRCQVARLEDRDQSKRKVIHHWLWNVLRLVSVVDRIPLLSKTTTHPTTLPSTSVPALPIPVAGPSRSSAVSPSSDPALSYRLRRALYHLVKAGVCGIGGATLLHMACNMYDPEKHTCDKSHLPIVSVVNLLLHVGADPNVRDFDGRAPLHVVCRQSKPLCTPLVQALLDGGAHVDMCDWDRVSPLDRLRKEAQGPRQCPVASTTLKCLAARAVAENFRLNPNLYRGLLGKDLEDFIDMH